MKVLKKNLGVVLFMGRNNCPYSKKIKNFLKEKSKKLKTYIKIKFINQFISFINRFGCVDLNGEA